MSKRRKLIKDRESWISRFSSIKPNKAEELIIKCFSPAETYLFPIIHREYEYWGEQFSEKLIKHYPDKKPLILFRTRRKDLYFPWYVLLNSRQIVFASHDFENAEIFTQEEALEHTKSFSDFLKRRK